MNKAIGITRLLVFLTLSFCLSDGGIGSSTVASAQQKPTASGGQGQKSSHLLKVPLPLDSRAASQVQRQLQNIVDGYSETLQVGQGPVVVLEFDNSRGATGQGSSYGAAIDLARFLASKELKWLTTVSYVPARKTTDNDGNEKFSGRLVGHAVLVALATDQLKIHPEATIGSAGIDESIAEAYIVEAYRSVSSSRLSIPPPVALAMLDAKAGLYRVVDSRRFVNAAELKELEAAGEATESRTLTEVGNLTELSGNELLEFQLVRQTTADRAELATQLGLGDDDLQFSTEELRNWRAVRVPMPKFIDQTTAQWVLRALDPRISADHFNLVIFEFDSLSGDHEACLLLAQRMISYDSDEIRTVAFIRGEAAGPAAMLALSCDHVVMMSEAKLGGQYDPEIPAEDLTDLKLAAAGIAADLDKDAALIQAMLDPAMNVTRFRNVETGRQRLLTKDQADDLPDADSWKPVSDLDVFDPIAAPTAEKLGIARQIVSNIDELESFYQLENQPELLTPTELDRWLQQTANWLASPFIAPWLLFIAMFCLFNEFSQPGLGVPGFMGAICLMLYFWSQHLDGNADWLEIMMFVLGIIFILVEIFVLPGFGLFGIGGLCLTVVSIVLAAQTFTIPTNSEEFRQLPRSLFALLGALAGLVAAMVLLSTVLPRTPVFRRLMLEPPTGGEESLDGQNPESMVNWGHLVGVKGVAITNLAPSGKARLSGQLIDVVSDGRLIEKDLAIKVVEVAGNRVVVVPVD